jgi:hypothetical protein
MAWLWPPAPAPATTPEPLFYSHRGIEMQAFVYALIIIVCRLASYGMARRFSRLVKLSSDVPSTADNLYSIFFHSFIGYLACRAVFSLGGTLSLGSHLCSSLAVDKMLLLAAAAGCRAG